MGRASASGPAPNFHFNEEYVVHLHLTDIDAEVAGEGITILVRTESRGTDKPGKIKGKLKIRNRKVEWFSGQSQEPTSEAKWDELIDWFES